MIATIRPLSQQLAKPRFGNPKELVSWMGAIQAQDYVMGKWAIGVRLVSGCMSQVEKALAEGEILRTHILRPTWHFVVAEDIRWMLMLSGERIKAAWDSYAKKLEIEEPVHHQCCDFLQRLLEGNNYLTKQEIAMELGHTGLPCDPSRTNYMLSRAEAMGIICSGADKNGKPTYALLGERAPQAIELNKDEALAELARRYFSSHSPAGLNDFVWWSGLRVADAKRAICLIASELIKETYETQDFYIHAGWKNSDREEETVHLLPSYDEYLISYKDRAAVLNPVYNSKAFNNYGIFYPVIMHEGRITGNWKKEKRKGEINIETSFFEKSPKIDPQLIQDAKARFLKFSYPLSSERKSEDK